MPNWCFNQVEVHGGDEDGWERERFFSEKDFGVTTPLQKYIPVSTYHMTTEGYNDGGYEWCLRNWGTKWPEKGLDLISDDDICLSFAFDTPWAPPIEGYQSISLLFPQLYFLHHWREDGMCFAGTAIYNDGHVVFMREIEGDGFPEWKDEYETDLDVYDEKVQEMMDSLMGDAYRALQIMTHIE